MYERFIEIILSVVRHLNNHLRETDQGGGDAEVLLTPYVDHVPLLLEGALVGFIRDEIGGEYQYIAATKEEEEWWSTAPWHKRTRT